MDAFIEEGGTKAITDMKIFTPSDFDRIWLKIRDHVTRNWNVVRGRKSQHKPKDVLFMLLSVLKHAGSWDFLAKMFQIKGPTFEKLISGFHSTAADTMYELFVLRVRDKQTMAHTIYHKNCFKEFPYCEYGIDVTFQQSNRPSGNMQEAKVYYSGKHELYGFKTEVSVNSRGYAVDCTPHYPGSVADMDIFHKNIDFHRAEIEKRADNRGKGIQPEAVK